MAGVVGSNPTRPIYETFTNTEFTKNVIFIFSCAGISAVSYMIWLRLKTLKDKAITIFKFLTALETIKTDGGDFKTTLENIERYLDNNDWVPAEYWLSRVMREYKEIYVSEARKV